MAEEVYNAAFQAFQRDLWDMAPDEVRRLRGPMADSVELPPEPVADVEDIYVPGGDGCVPARVYTPASVALGVPRPILIWLHGGGMVLGDNYVQSDRPARRMANRTGCVVLAVDYRLAPENPFPAGVRDCQAAMRWAAAHGDEIVGDRNRLAVEGDSGGGLPAAVCAVTARDEGIPLRHQLLVYPNLDCTITEPTWETHGYHGFDRRVMEWFMSHYLPPGADPRDPLASPVFTPDLFGVAPCTIIAAELDPLVGEARTFTGRLRAAGVDVDLQEWPQMPHGFFVMPASYPEALTATDYAAARLREALAP
jgi:acetyl esterase